MSNLANLDRGQERLARDWVSDLRSGALQRRNALGGPAVGFCCLGLLTHRVVEDDLTPEGCHVQRQPEGTLIQEDKGAYLSSTMIPPSIRALVGLTEETSAALAFVNDYGATFPEIANMVEKWLDEGTPITESTAAWISDTNQLNTASRAAVVEAMLSGEKGNAPSMLHALAKLTAKDKASWEPVTQWSGVDNKGNKVLFVSNAGGFKPASAVYPSVSAFSGSVAAFEKMSVAAKDAYFALSAVTPAQSETEEAVPPVAVEAPTAAVPDTVTIPDDLSSLPEAALSEAELVPA